MSKKQAPSSSWVGLHPRFRAKVERLGNPPLPWTWAIYEHGQTDPCQLSGGEFFRTPEEAWKAGSASLAGMRDPADPVDEYG